MKKLSEAEPTLRPDSSFQVLDSHQRMLDRQAAREENYSKERQAMDARLSRNKRLTAEERVFEAAKKLEKANSSLAIRLIGTKSAYERDFFLLAEEYVGPNRREVLRQFPAPRKRTREAFLGATPDQKDSVKDESPQPEAVNPALLVDKNGKPLTGAILANRLRKIRESQTEE